MAELRTFQKDKVDIKKILDNLGVRYEVLDDVRFWSRFNIPVRDIRLLVIMKDGYKIYRRYSGRYYCIMLDDFLTGSNFWTEL